MTQVSIPICGGYVSQKLEIREYQNHRFMHNFGKNVYFSLVIRRFPLFSGYQIVIQRITRDVCIFENRWICLILIITIPLIYPKRFRKIIQGVSGIYTSLTVDNFTNILNAAFCTKVLRAVYLDLRFVLFWPKNIGSKAARKMLVKLTPGGLILC